MKNFLTSDDEKALVEEIRKLETRTSGEVRIVISSKWILRPHLYAWKLFRKLGMEATAHRNGALIVVIHRRRKFVVLGDIGLADIVESGYWENVASAMSQHLKQGNNRDALAEGIRLLGEPMASHWPPSESNPDELPNEIVQD